MGLFSFLKNAGAKIFSGEKVKEVTVPADEAKKIAEEAIMKRQKMILMRGVVDSLGIKVENLDLALHGDEVTVYGQVDTQAEKEKVILALGNVEGVATVDDRISVVNPEPEAKFYTVKSGDTLSKISKEFYGDAMKYNVIFEANKPMLSHPDKIYPGQVLRIPAL